MDKKCFGTKEYSDKSIICRKCKLRTKCKKIRPKIKFPEEKLSYIKRSDYRVWRS